MELRQLRYFIAVAEELNFTHAANRLGIAQPPLSQQIITLEHQLRAQLFIRTKRKVELTPAGEVLLSHARRVINATQEAEEAVRTASAGGSGRLQLGAMYSTLHALIPTILRECALTEPNLVIDVRELTVAQQRQALNEASIDLAIVRGQIDGAHLTGELLFEESFVAALPEDLVDNNGPVSPDWLATCNFVSMSRRSNSHYSDLLRRFANPLGGELKIAQEASDMHTLLCLVAAGIGVAIVPSSISDARIGGIAYRPIDGPTPVTSVNMAWRRDNDSALLPRLVSRIRSVVEREQDQKDQVGELTIQA